VLGREISGKMGGQGRYSRSPDLTPLDFFMWAFVKGIVYQSLVTGTDDLRKRSTDDIITIRADMLL
jgi:hypothetical protein